MSKKGEAIKLLEGLEKGLKDKFNNLREKHFNTITKGYEYEKILKDFLESYLGGLYDFHVRVPLIDIELESLSIFTSGENEFDVVSTYKTAVPRIVLKAYETSFVPYDAVAFIAEVKQTMTKASLKGDLKKLNKLSKLKTGDRFGVHFAGNYVIRRPLRTLFYYESDIADNTEFKLLIDYENAWDLVAILMDDVLLGNPALPTIGKRFKTDEIFSFNRYPLMWLMLHTTASLPCPPIVNAWSLFGRLLAFTFT